MKTVAQDHAHRNLRPLNNFRLSTKLWIACQCRAVVLPGFTAGDPEHQRIISNAHEPFCARFGFACRIHARCITILPTIPTMTVTSILSMIAILRGLARQYRDRRTWIDRGRRAMFYSTHSPSWGGQARRWSKMNYAPSHPNSPVVTPGCTRARGGRDHSPPVRSSLCAYLQNRWPVEFCGPIAQGGASAASNVVH